MLNLRTQNTRLTENVQKLETENLHLKEAVYKCEKETNAAVQRVKDDTQKQLTNQDETFKQANETLKGRFLS